MSYRRHAITENLILSLSEHNKLVDSWTTSNFMWLYINLNTVTVERMTSMFIHEMFQTIDPKNHISFMRQILPLDQKANYCTAIGANINPEVRFSTSAVRSLKMEQKILSEITGRASGLSTEINKRLCTGAVVWTKDFLKEFFKKNSGIGWFTNWSTIPAECGERLFLRRNFEEFLSLLESSQELCTFLTEPDLDVVESIDLRKYPKTLYYGPRPIIGGI